MLCVLYLVLCDFLLGIFSDHLSKRQGFKKIRAEVMPGQIKKIRVDNRTYLGRFLLITQENTQIALKSQLS